MVCLCNVLSVSVQHATCSFYNHTDPNVAVGSGLRYSCQKPYCLSQKIQFCYNVKWTAFNEPLIIRNTNTIVPKSTISSISNIFEMSMHICLAELTSVSGGEQATVNNPRPQIQYISIIFSTLSWFLFVSYLVTIPSLCKNCVS